MALYLVSSQKKSKRWKQSILTTHRNTYCNPALAKVINQLVDGTYDPTHQLFKELHDSLVYGVEGQRPDVYYVLADFDSYCKAQEKISAAYVDRKAWARKALINIANSGKFSSDRTIEDYVRDIWKLDKLVIK